VFVYFEKICLHRYVVGTRMPKLRRAHFIVGGTILVCLLSSRLPSLLRRRRIIPAGGSDVSSGDAAKKKKIDKNFFLYLKSLFKICVPGLWSKEAGALLLHTAFLVTRTIISIIIAKLDGSIVKAIVERKQVPSPCTLHHPCNCALERVLEAHRPVDAAWRARLHDQQHD
jgi:hypothetical protein